MQKYSYYDFFQAQLVLSYENKSILFSGLEVVMDFDFMAIFVLYFADNQKKSGHVMKQNRLTFL